MHVRNLFEGDEKVRVAHGKPPCQVKRESIESGDVEDDVLMGLAFHSNRGSCIDLVSGDDDGTDARDSTDAQTAK
eukprot:6176697-Pleurochrysis_carterae.AAC.3